MISRLASLLRPRRLAAWSGGLLFLTAFFYAHAMSTPGYIDRVGRFKGTDYIQFYVMGSMVLEGRPEALFDGTAHLAEGRRRIDPTLDRYAAHPNYGPQVALAIVPLALLPFGWSLAVFLGLMALCYAGTVWLLWRDCPGLRDYGWPVAIIAAASPAFWAMIRYGQLSAVTLLLIALALTALRRDHLYAAGLAIGGLAFKPQLGVVIAVVLIAARERRIVAGALTSVAGQLAIGWAAAGTAAMSQYIEVLWRLLLDPSLVQLHPTEVHSVRGFLQLMIPSAAAVTMCYWVSLLALLPIAVRSWTSGGPVTVRWGSLVVLTTIGAPHLLTYDLLLLTVPLLILADWCVRHADDPRRPAVALLLVPVYLAPFSGNFARLIHVQLSVVAMVLLAWCVHRLLTERADSTDAAGRHAVVGLEAPPAT